MLYYRGVEMKDEFDETAELHKVVKPDSPLKEWLIDYVGQDQEPHNDEVTVEMIIDTIAKEFPEFLLVIAEENFIRGYSQALADVTEGEKLHKQEQQMK